MRTHQVKNGKVEITFAELEQRAHERGETIIGYYRPSVLLRERGVVQVSRLCISTVLRHWVRLDANVCRSMYASTRCQGHDLCVRETSKKSTTESIDTFWC
jgi:hypothetical protein